LRRKVEEESKPIVVCPQRLLTFALLVFALKELKLSEPLIDSVSDFRPTGVVLVLNDRDVGIESFEVCLFAFAGGDCLVKVIAGVFPWASAVSQRVRRK
jgi:hypothetical protein